MKLDKKKLKVVIDKLKSVEHLASKEGMFNMDSVKLDYNYDQDICNTPHCVAGCYGLAYRNDDHIRASIESNNGSFANGAALMVRDLGFKYIYELEEYFKDNPKLWGNNRGEDLFDSVRAYNYPGFSGVIKHFEEVYNRL